MTKGLLVCTHPSHFSSRWKSSLRHFREFCWRLLLWYSLEGDKAYSFEDRPGILQAAQKLFHLRSAYPYHSLDQTNRDKIYSKRKFTAIVALQYFIGYASTHLVNYSVVVIIHLVPIFFLVVVLVPQSLSPTYQIPTMLPVDLGEIHLFAMVSPSSNKHCMLCNRSYSPYA